MADLLVLWDVDYTLVSADGLGTRLYEAVFREMFGRELNVVAPMAGRTDRAIAGDTLALAAAGVRQSVLTGNLRPLAELKLRRAGLGDDLDLDAGAYGDVHEVRSELVAVARRAARRAYGVGFPGAATVLVGDTPLDVEAALATGARVVAVATGSYPASELAAAGASLVLPDLTDSARVVAAVTGPGPAGAAGRAR